MRRIRIIIREDLNEREKNELRKHFAGHCFCLKEMIENGFETYYYSLDSLKRYWKNYAKDFIEIDGE